MSTKAPASILGISFEDRHVEAVVLKRTGRRVLVRQAARTALSLDPMTNDPQLVGREIRNHLTNAGIHEKRCVVCVPLHWVLTLRTELPEMSEADVASYLEVRAERELPFAPADLSMAILRSTTPSGRKDALIAAIPRHHLDALLRALKAARLRPIGIALGVVSLLATNTSSAEGCVTLLAGRDRVDLAVSIGRNLAALRSLEEVSDPAQETSAVDGGLVARQIRITLGQLPPDVRNAVTSIHLSGPSDQTERLLSVMSEHAKRLGLSLGVVAPYQDFVAPEAGLLARVSPGLVAAAAERLRGDVALADFLPPRVSRLRQITGRISSRATLWLAGAAAALVVGIGGALVYQHWRLSRLEANWKTIEPRVQEATVLQQKIRRFRGWFDDSARNLVIARRLTEAFPEDGAVWAKSFEIRETPESDRPTVSCSGKARTNRDWLLMLERLRETKGIGDLRFEQMRGERPLQFTLSFRWNEGEADGF